MSSRDTLGVGERGLMSLTETEFRVWDNSDTPWGDRNPLTRGSPVRSRGWECGPVLPGTTPIPYYRYQDKQSGVTKSIFSFLLTTHSLREEVPM